MADALPYADALAELQAVADARGHAVRRLEGCRHQLVSPAGVVMCTLSMRHGVPTIQHGWYSIFLHDRSDARSAAARITHPTGSY